MSSFKVKSNKNMQEDEMSGSEPEILRFPHLSQVYISKVK
jgi:hypothetical protein